MDSGQSLQGTLTLILKGEEISKVDLLVLTG